MGLLSRCDPREIDAKLSAEPSLKAALHLMPRTLRALLAGASIDEIDAARAAVISEAAFELAWKVLPEERARRRGACLAAVDAAQIAPQEEGPAASCSSKAPKL